LPVEPAGVAARTMRSRDGLVKPPAKPAAASSIGSAAPGSQAEASTKNSIALAAMPPTATRSWRA